MKTSCTWKPHCADMCTLIIQVWLLYFESWRNNWIWVEVQEQEMSLHTKRHFIPATEKGAKQHSFMSPQSQAHYDLLRRKRISHETCYTEVSLTSFQWLQSQWNLVHYLFPHEHFYKNYFITDYLYLWTSRSLITHDGLQKDNLKIGHDLKNKSFCSQNSSRSTQNIKYLIAM